MAPKTSNSRLDAALDLARRMPAAAAPATLEAMLTLLPKSEASLVEELVERVEQPLEKALDDAAVRVWHRLLCGFVHSDESAGPILHSPPPSYSPPPSNRAGPSS